MGWLSTSSSTAPPTSPVTSSTGWRRWLRAAWEEWRSRRAGRRHVPNHIGRQARDVVGATGWAFSRSWDEVAKVRPAYLRSFERDRVVPPSLHVSHRDRVRSGDVVPLAERCIEDYAKPARERPGPWSTKELGKAVGPPSRRR